MEDRMHILELIEAGELSVEEGARRLDALVEDAEGAVSAEQPVSPTRPAFVRILWQAVFWTGVGLLARGGLLLANAYAREITLELTWGWTLFTLGVLITGLGWWLERARWFYLRVKERDGAGFALALPMPLRLLAWLLRVPKPFIPQLQETGADALILVMRDELRDGHPFVLDVDEGENGEQVKMYFC